MLASGIPTKFPLYWAQNASSSYVRQVPSPSQTGVNVLNASFNDGFPPATFQIGGAPDGRDANGVLQQLSQWAQWDQAKGPVYWDSAFATAIGGYPHGAFLNAVGIDAGYWFCTVDNNLTNPDASGAGWTFCQFGAQSGRLLKTTVYAIVGGVQQVSVNGGAFTTSGATVFTSGGGTNAIRARVQGGGGAGGSVPAGSSSGPTGYASGGGAGGNYGESWFTTGFTGGIATTVGTGGSPGAAGNNAGGNGNTSSLGALMSMGGGTGGGSGGAFQSNDWTTSGSVGTPSATASGANIMSVVGQGGFFGMFASSSGCTQGAAMSGAGGDSFLGRGGYSLASQIGPVASQTGVAGTGYGAGGGGCYAIGGGSSARQGGAGAAGIIIIEEWA